MTILIAYHINYGYLPSNVLWYWIPSGKRLHNYGKNHRAINGKIHYFDWAIFNSYVNVYQRVSLMMFTNINAYSMSPTLHGTTIIYVANNFYHDKFLFSSTSSGFYTYVMWHVPTVCIATSIPFNYFGQSILYKLKKKLSCKITLELISWFLSLSSLIVVTMCKLIIITLRSGKRLHSYGKSPILIGKSTN